MACNVVVEKGNAKILISDNNQFLLGVNPVQKYYEANQCSFMTL